MLVSKIGRPWKFHVFPKNTLVLEVFDVKGNVQKIWNFLETLSRHVCRTVQSFMFLLLILLFLWINEFQNHVFYNPLFMLLASVIRCNLCFNDPLQQPTKIPWAWYIIELLYGYAGVMGPWSLIWTVFTIPQSTMTAALWFTIRDLCGDFGQWLFFLVSLLIYDYHIQQATSRVRGGEGFRRRTVSTPPPRRTDFALTVNADAMSKW